MTPLSHSGEPPPEAPLDADVEFDRRVTELVDARLAAMGGDLLSTYGRDAPSYSSPEIAEPMSSLGGYLLERFGKKPTN